MAEPTTAPGLVLLLVLGDHSKYFHVNGDCILAGLPFEVVVFCNRVSADYFADAGADGGNVRLQQVPWSDFEQVRAAALALAAREPVGAVISLNELLLELAAELRVALDLPGMAPALLRRFRDKLLMKQVLGDAGLRVPAHARCDDRAAVDRLLKRHARLVIKPVDGVGACRVSFIDSAAQLEAWYAGDGAVTTATAAGYEAEEFIDGTLYHVNAVVRGGAVLLTACALYEPGMANIDYRGGMPFVSVIVDDAPLRRRLTAFSDAVIGALGMRDGVTHLECFVTPAGEIVLCEVAARPGGGGIVEMIESQFGVNYSLAAILLESGRGHLLHIPAAPPAGCVGLMGFRLARNGRIARIAAPALFDDACIRCVRIDTAPGRFARAAAHCTDFIGLLVFAADDYGDFCAKRAQLQHRFDAALEVTH